MTWQKLKKTLNILRRSACKFRTKTHRNLLGTGLGTNYFLMLKTLKTQPCFSSPHNQAKLSGHSTGPSLPRGGHHFQSFHPDFAPGLGRWHHGPKCFCQPVPSARRDVWLHHTECDYSHVSESEGLCLHPLLLQPEPQGFNCLWACD